MAVKIGRRQVISALASAAAAWPFSARAQPAGTARVGILISLPEGDPEGERWLRSLHGGLESLGWKEGANLQLDVRWGDPNPDRLQAIAKELVSLKPDVIQVTATPPTAAVLRETRTIPIVFAVVSDPVGSGFVQSLAHPGGNVTGFVNIEGSVGGKWIELLKEIAPRTAHATVMFNPNTAPQSAFYMKSVEAAAASLAISVAVAKVNSRDDIERAISDLARVPDSGLIVSPDLFTATKDQRDTIIDLTARNHIPAVYFLSLFARTGGLLAYSVDHSDLLRRAAAYVDRILKGEKPESLPVQLPTKFEFVINLKTAKSLGLTVPPSLVATADEVIE
jgi:putative tryptophan/tyrosine transport system substrate-binding protein